MHNFIEQLLCSREIVKSMCLLCKNSVCVSSVKFHTTVGAKFPHMHKVQ
jgi:hypothetical protein